MVLVGTGWCQLQRSTIIIASGWKSIGSSWSKFAFICLCPLLGHRKCLCQGKIKYLKFLFDPSEKINQIIEFGSFGAFLGGRVSGMVRRQVRRGSSGSFEETAAFPLGLRLMEKRPR